MENLTSIMWILVGLAVAVYIFYYNKGMQDVTNKMIGMIFESEKRCNDLLGRIRETQDAEVREKLIKELQDEADRFWAYKNDREKWEGQEPRITKHLKKIKFYIDTAKEIENQ